MQGDEEGVAPARGHGLQQGVGVRRGVLGWGSRGKLMSLRTRLVLAALASLAGWAALAWFGAPAIESQWALLLAGAALAPAAFAWLDHRIVRPLRIVLDEALELAAAKPPRTQAPLDRADEIGLLQRAVRQAGLNAQALPAGAGAALDALAAAHHDPAHEANAAAAAGEAGVPANPFEALLFETRQLALESRAVIEALRDAAAQARDVAEAAAPDAARSPVVSHIVARVRRVDRLLAELSRSAQVPPATCTNCCDADG